MFAIFFLALLLVALVSLSSEIIMRVRLSRLEPRTEKLLWWRKGGDEIAAAYRQIFPGAMLPIFRLFAFWLFLATVLVLFCLLMLKRHMP